MNILETICYYILTAYGFFTLRQLYLFTNKRQSKIDKLSVDEYYGLFNEKYSHEINTDEDSSRES